MQTPDASRATWRKSTRSNGAGGNCVEVADLTANVGMRDSKAPDAGHLTFDLDTWAAFVTDVKADRYDLP